MESDIDAARRDEGSSVLYLWISWSVSPRPSVGKVRPREKTQGVFGPKTLQLVCSHIHLPAEIQLFFLKNLEKAGTLILPCANSLHQPPHKKGLINRHIKLKRQDCCFSPTRASFCFLSCVHVGTQTNRRLARRATDTAGCQSCTFTLLHQGLLSSHLIERL